MEIFLTEMPSGNVEFKLMRNKNQPMTQKEIKYSNEIADALGKAMPGISERLGARTLVDFNKNKAGNS